MRLSLLLAFLVSSTVALAADRQINQISVEQSDSQTIIRLFGSDLIRSPKDRVFFAAEASSYSVESTMMYGDAEYVEVALGMPVMAGQYRISIGPNENTSTLESMVVIGAIGPQGPAGRDGADGRDGVDGLDGSPGADGRNGGDGVDGINGVNGQDGADGQNGVDGSSCSASQDGSSVLITCADGTSGILAGAGTVVVYPQNGVFGEAPDISTLPQGQFVWMDGNQVVVAPFSRTGFQGGFLSLYTGDGVRVRYYQDESAAKLRIRKTISRAYYTEPDCKGVMISSSSPRGLARIEGAFFVPGQSLPQPILTPSKREADSYDFVSDSYRVGACEEVTGAELLPNGGPLLVPYNPPAEFINAIYPLRLVQLP